MNPTLPGGPLWGSVISGPLIILMGKTMNMTMLSERSYAKEYMAMNPEKKWHIRGRFTASSSWMTN